MARARNIKPGFYKNEDLAECSIWARFIFPGLWMLADRDGRLEDRPKRIKAELLPFDNGDMDKLLQELHDRGFLVRYQNSDGLFIQISKFSEHQSPHYSEKPSGIKPPSLQECSEKTNGHCDIETPGTLQENSGSEQVIKRGSQPPDSLIPDSLIPDSGEKQGARSLALPAWVPREAWDGWIAMRKAKKAPNTLRALSLAVGTLDRLRGQGDDPQSVLDRSTERGWTGLFPLRDPGNGKAPGFSTVPAERL